MYIARACSHASRVPVSAGRPVPSPCLAATAAPQQIVAERRRATRMICMWPTRAGATADRRRKQLQRGAGISAAHQRGAAVQQHAGARGGRTLCLLVVCAMTTGGLDTDTDTDTVQGTATAVAVPIVHFIARLLVLIPGRPARRSPPTSAFARLALHTAMLSMLLIAPD